MNHFIPQQICPVPRFKMFKWNGAWCTEDLIVLGTNQITIRICLQDWLFGADDHAINSFLQ